MSPPVSKFADIELEFMLSPVELINISIDNMLKKNTNNKKPILGKASLIIFFVFFIRFLLIKLYHVKLKMV